MNKLAGIKNEQQAGAAFSRQAAVFDQVYTGDKIIQYKRTRVRSHVDTFLHPKSHILELNAGTGEDAIHFAKLGHFVHATDISDGMQDILKEKIALNELDQNISAEVCSFTQLADLKNKGPFDLIFSNFAGLNCTSDLKKVLLSFGPLLNPGGMVTLVLLPKFCLWESLLVFKGRFKTAFRRFFSRKGRRAHIEGEYFRCWYYNPSYVTGCLKHDFTVVALEGLCTLVPPSYIEKFGDKHAKTFQLLKKWEEKWKTKFPWRSIGDYYIISLRKNA